VRCVTEGTRLTLQATAAPADGYTFTIRTPGTPPRWKVFDATLSCVWRAQRVAALAPERADGAPEEVRAPGPGAGAGADSGEGAGESAGESGAPALLAGALAARLGPRTRRRVELALAFYFYWINFGPLSRGTSGVGMSVLIAMLLAQGLRLDRQLPRKVQLDWEAILSPHPAAFTAAIADWLSVALQPLADGSGEEVAGTGAAPQIAVLDALPLVSETFPTLRSVLRVLGSVGAPEL
jgi:hypothetical protein